MSDINTTESTPKPKKKYFYWRITVRRADGKKSTVSFDREAGSNLLILAAGSATGSARRHVTDTCREAARELVAEGFTGKFSPAVYQRTFAKLRGAYRKEHAVAFEQSQFPEGTPVAA